MLRLETTRHAGFSYREGSYGGLPTASLAPDRLRNMPA